jgi:hypothetical protein
MKCGLCGKKFLLGKSDPDNGLNSMDSTINRAHQHAAGAKHGEEAAIGRSRGGLSTKVHMLADGQGNPLHFDKELYKKRHTVENFTQTLGSVPPALDPRLRGDDDGLSANRGHALIIAILHILMYYEEHVDIRSAIEREKQLKNWNRSWKLKLIESNNPNWKDLSSPESF